MGVGFSVGGFGRYQLSSFKMRLYRQGTLERVAPGCIEAAAARVWLGDPETTCAVFEHPPTTLNGMGKEESWYLPHAGNAIQ